MSHKHNWQMKATGMYCKDCGKKYVPATRGHSKKWFTINKKILKIN